MAEKHEATVQARCFGFLCADHDFAPHDPVRGILAMREG